MLMLLHQSDLFVLDTVTLLSFLAIQFTISLAKRICENGASYAHWQIHPAWVQNSSIRNQYPTKAIWIFFHTNRNPKIVNGKSLRKMTQQCECNFFLVRDRRRTKELQRLQKLSRKQTVIVFPCESRLRCVIDALASLSFTSDLNRVWLNAAQQKCI